MVLETAGTAVFDPERPPQEVAVYIRTAFSEPVLREGFASL
jgi:hypothetical protein